MKRILLTTAALGLLGATLAGCGGGGGSGMTVTQPPPVAARFEDQFGSAAGFGTAFRGTPNSEPRDVAPGDTIPVSLTAEPLTLPGT